LNLNTAMTANVSDVLVVVVCFYAVTKPASICNHKKFRNHENDSVPKALTFHHSLKTILKLSVVSLIGVFISFYYSNICIFSANFVRRTKLGDKFG